MLNSNPCLAHCIGLPQLPPNQHKGQAEAELSDQTTKLLVKMVIRFPEETGNQIIEAEIYSPRLEQEKHSATLT